jgi:hypothetical protein
MVATKVLCANQEYTGSFFSQYLGLIQNCVLEGSSSLAQPDSPPEARIVGS